MALSVAPTLGELRLAIATRIGMGRQIRNSTALHDFVDEHIRSAFHVLVREADWAILDVSREFDLIAGQHAYDVPDNIDVGDIRQVTVEDILNREYPLQPGVSVVERNAWRVDRNPQSDPQTAEDAKLKSSLPLRWEVVDTLIHIYPAPDIERYPLARVYGRALPREPVDAGDRSFIDKEAHILATVIALKRHYAMEGVDNDERMLARHLQNIKAAQSDGESIQIGPTPSRRFTGPAMVGAPREAFWPDFDPFHPVNFRG